MSSGIDDEDATVRRYKEAADWLLRLNSEELSDDDLAAWVSWCEADPHNLKSFEKLQADWRDIAALRQERTLHIPQTRTTRWGFVRRKQLVAAAALAAVVVFGALAWSVVGTAFHHREIIAHSANETLALPDGTALILRAQSNMRLDFTPTERAIALHDGEAFFKVRKDPARPFVVRTGSLEILTIGTAFDVRRERGYIQVIVEEGRVRISAGGHPTWFASAGERFEFSQPNADEMPSAVLVRADPPRELGWRKGEFVYDGVPLREVLQDVNRYAARPIEVRDARVAEIPYTGTVFVRAMDDWLRALESLYPVRVVDTPNANLRLEFVEYP